MRNIYCTRPGANRPIDNDSASRPIWGLERVLRFEPTKSAEDFSFFVLEKPGYYFRWVTRGRDGCELRDTGQVPRRRPCGILLSHTYTKQVLI